MFLTIALPGHALSADDTGLPVYVSEQFKRVAKRAFKEVLSYEIAKACSENASLCKTVVLRVSDALSAAIDDDHQALRIALDGLFVDTSIAALLQSTLGPLQTDPPEAVRALVPPVLRCLAGALGEKPLRSSCTLDESEWQAATRVTPDIFKGKDDQEIAKQFLSAVTASHRISPGLALKFVSALAVVNGVERPDIRVLALRLAAFYDQGLEQGLFDATLRFLTTDLGPLSGDGYTAGVLIDYPTDSTVLPFLKKNYRNALIACGQDPGAYDRWDKQKAQYITDLRASVLLGSSLDLAPLEDLLKYDGSCPGPADSEVRELKRFVRYFVSPLRTYHAISRYGPPALVVAAVLDFVRSGDEQRFHRDLKRSLAYAIAQLGLKSWTEARLHEEAKTPPVPLTRKNMIWIVDALNSCELQAISDKLEIRFPSATSSPMLPGSECLSLATGAKAPTTQWFKANGSQLLSALEPLLKRLQTSQIAHAWEQDVDIETLRRGINYLSTGDEAAARKIVVRLGLDMLVAQVEQYTAKIIGGSEESCMNGYRSRSIFSGMDAACAAHLLVLTAYRPIADFYWSDTEAKAGSTSDVAGTVYRGLLASPVLDYTPIILNLGVGGTYVLGHDDVWGSGGYGALTLIDKIGFAVYKYNGVGHQFETGIFVGGFLDALIRTATSTGKNQRYWLLGWTVGWPKLWAGGIGIEAHVGAAMPFELGDGRRYGFAAGISAVVPFTWVFEGK